MRDLTRLLTTIDVLGIVCVIDRPGYDARYREKYGRRQWHLCQTAFCIAVERAAKFARREGRKLRVMPERSCRADDQRLVNYYEQLKAGGPPFDRVSSSTYVPLTGDELADTLYEIRFKSKSSPLGQIADLFLWPLALAAYDPKNRAYVALQDAGRLIESRLARGEGPVCGSKHSCFELVDLHKRGAWKRQRPRPTSEPLRRPSCEDLVGYARNVFYLIELQFLLSAWKSVTGSAHGTLSTCREF